MPSSSSTKHARGAHSRGAHGGSGGSHSGDDGGGGGGGGGPLVKVGFARSEPEAEMMQGLLLEEGIPSVLKRAGGFDNPDFLAAGPRDIFTSQAHARRAREVLAETMLESEAEERAEIEGGGAPGSGVSLERRILWMVAAAVAAVLIVWLLYQVT